MYCKYCGKEIYDDAVICIHCGRNTSFKQLQKWMPGVYILLILAALLIPLSGLLVGLLNIDKASKKEQSSTLIVISLVNIFISILFLL